MHAEAAAIAGWCASTGFPMNPFQDGRHDVLALQQAEKLCSTFELYRALLPEPHRSKFSFEHALLLVTTLSCREEIELKRCTRCGAEMLAKALEDDEDLCVFCRPLGRGAAETTEDGGDTQNTISGGAIKDSEAELTRSQKNLF